MSDKEYLSRLQSRLANAFSHMYLYFFKQIANDELPILKNNLNPIEVEYFNQEAIASRVRCFIYMRSFFDSGKSDISLFNLYKELITSTRISDSSLATLFDKFKEAKDKITTKTIIIKHILGTDCYTKYEKIKSITDKRVAHFDKDQNPVTSYDDLEKLALRIEKIIYQTLPVLLFGKEDNWFDHIRAKDEIKGYLSKLYINRAEKVK